MPHQSRCQSHDHGSTGHPIPPLRRHLPSFVKSGTFPRYLRPALSCCIRNHLTCYRYLYPQRLSRLVGQLSSTLSLGAGGLWSEEGGKTLRHKHLCKPSNAPLFSSPFPHVFPWPTTMRGHHQTTQIPGSITSLPRPPIPGRAPHPPVRGARSLRPPSPPSASQKCACHLDSKREPTMTACIGPAFPPNVSLSPKSAGPLTTSARSHGSDP